MPNITCSRATCTNLSVAPGQHTVWARATYTNVTPTLFLDSPVSSNT